MAIDLSVHTMELRNRLSADEARYICKLYGKSLSKSVEISGTEIKIAGINQIDITATKIPASGIFVYDTKIMINVGRLIRKTNHAMLVWNKANASAVASKLDDIFDNRFILKPKHSDSKQWHIARLDCGLDLKLCTDDEVSLKAFIEALHNSFDCNNSRGIQYLPYKGYDKLEVRQESLTLCTAKSITNASDKNYEYNIYYKLLQLRKKAQADGRTLSQNEIDEIKDVIRIEKQIYKVDKAFGCSNKLGSLLQEDVSERVMNAIIKEIRIMFGAGDYLEYEEGIRKICASNFSIQIQNQMRIVYTLARDNGYVGAVEEIRKYVIANGGTEKYVISKMAIVSDAKKKLETLGLSIASLENIEFLNGINPLIEKEMKTRAKPRRKAGFCEIKQITEKSGKKRYKCNPTLHKADGSTYRTSIAGKMGGTREECEEIIYEKIRANLNENYTQLKGQRKLQVICCKYAILDYKDFLTIAKSETVRTDTEKMIDKIESRIIKIQQEGGAGNAV